MNPADEDSTGSHMNQIDKRNSGSHKIPVEDCIAGSQINPVKECNPVEKILQWKAFELLSQRRKFAMKNSFHLNHSDQRKNISMNTKKPRYGKSQRRSIAMEIVFITHTSQRRSLATMRDCNGKYEISTHPVPVTS